MSPCIKIGALASGSGTNLQAIIDNCQAGRIDGTVVVVVSDVADARCLERARKHDIEAVHVEVPKTGTQGWAEANRQIARVLSAHQVDLVVMAGYMRKVSGELLRSFPQAVMNIHPALLPSFPGAHGQRDAADYGVKIAGLTVHFADEEFDTGPIIIQAAVPVSADDDEDCLGDRILRFEHKCYSQAIQWFAQGRLTINGRRVVVAHTPDPEDQYLLWPPLEMD